jgi:hypothetical protein
MRKLANPVHGHIIWSTDGISSHHQNIIARKIVTSNTPSKQLSDTVQLQHKLITNSSITHTNKVIHALAECAKAIQGMTSKARVSQATQDLQHIIDTTQAHVQTNPHKFEEIITPDNIHKHKEFQGCRHHQAFPYPILMTTDKSRALCTCRHQF